MKGIRLPQPPEQIGTFWWRASFGLWVLVLLAAGLLVVRGPVIPTLAGAWGQVQAWAGAASDPRSAVNLGPAPDFTLPLFDGGTFQLAGHRGQVVVINFWASWCVPCRNEAPRLKTAYQTYHDRGVEFIGVDIQDTDQDARAFIKKYGLSYPSGPDQGMKIANDYGVAGIPTTFVIDRQGQLHRRWLGEIQQDQLTGFIEEALR